MYSGNLRDYLFGGEQKEREEKERGREFKIEAFI